MKNHERVLKLLQKRRNKGVTRLDFYVGLHLNDCIMKLRDAGWHIITHKYYPDGKGKRWMGRYTLHGRNK